MRELKWKERRLKQKPLASARISGWGEIYVTPSTVTFKAGVKFIARIKLLLERQRRIPFRRIGEPTRMQMDPRIIEVFMRKLYPVMEGIDVLVEWDWFGGLMVNGSGCKPLVMPKASLISHLIESGSFSFVRHSAGWTQHSWMDVDKAQRVWKEGDTHALANLACKVLLDGKQGLAEGLAKTVILGRHHERWQPMDSFLIERIGNELFAHTIFGERVRICAAATSLKREPVGPLRWAQLESGHKESASKVLQEVFQ